MQVGIDRFNFYVPKYYIDLKDLAKARGEDPNKYLIGLGQEEQAVPPLSQDTISLALNAAYPLITEEDRQAIDLVILATETSVDQSKAGAILLHDGLNIQAKARCIEMKEACYSGTFALRTAVEHVTLHPNSKALVVCSDIARYGLKTSGEVTQGAGAVAMIIAAQPSIAVVKDDATYYSVNVNDFWRPNYTRNACVDGHYSNDRYLKALEETWTDYRKTHSRDLKEFKAFCFHLPYTKMGKKGLNQLTKDMAEEDKATYYEYYEASCLYNKRVGNIYTGSLYLSFFSLLENGKNLKAQDKIGMYSYGSGAVGEFYSLELVEGFENYLQPTAHANLLNGRQKLSIAEYENFFEEGLVEDGSLQNIPPHRDEDFFRLDKLEGHCRYYRK
ncbi:hydroxymethylglutaryl-CoA synthase [Aerococcus christensenii]|uniref:Hydroxymethylglutaryl-CoA synthase n=1 Tax=Aerococcus christensenii TaxID=87541 RepID=A0A2I1K929_9LACT|nr:hydroxymethylglutaryl-CoA synthase [Aerococcus christensenii]PKY92140.1 hydroxymethylglutaryl-CoA synthase [Aerococcus christensenii]